jgi:hypothetical protein
VLLARLEHEPRESVKYKILRALGRLRHDHPGVVLDMEVLDRVTAETLRAGRALQGWSAALTVALKREPRLCTPTGELLRELIDEKIHEVVERIFRLLSLAGGPEDHRRIHRCLYSGSATVRAGALELLDSTVPERYRHAILGLVPAEPIEARLARLALDESPGLESALEEMIAAPSATVSAFAAYCAAELGLPALRGSIERISLTADDDWAGAIRTVRRMLIGSDEAAS